MSDCQWRWRQMTLPFSSDSLYRRDFEAKLEKRKNWRKKGEERSGSNIHQGESGSMAKSVDSKMFGSLCKSEKEKHYDIHDSKRLIPHQKHTVSFQLRCKYCAARTIASPFTSFTPLWIKRRIWRMMFSKVIKNTQHKVSRYPVSRSEFVEYNISESQMHRKSWKMCKIQRRYTIPIRKSLIKMLTSIREIFLKREREPCWIFIISSKGRPGWKR